MGYSPWGPKESDTTEATEHARVCLEHLPWVSPTVLLNVVPAAVKAAGGTHSGPHGFRSLLPQGDAQQGLKCTLVRATSLQTQGGCPLDFWSLWSGSPPTGSISPSLRVNSLSKASWRLLSPHLGYPEIVINRNLELKRGGLRLLWQVRRRLLCAFAQPQAAFSSGCVGAMAERSICLQILVGWINE